MLPMWFLLHLPLLDPAVVGSNHVLPAPRLQRSIHYISRLPLVCPTTSLGSPEKQNQQAVCEW